MPILDVSIVLKAGETLSKDTARSLADEAGQIFGSDPGNTWVRFHTIEESCYAENKTEPDKTPNPVFVEILKAEDGHIESSREDAREIAARFSKILSRPRENTHVLYLPNGSGRIAFGGKLLEDADQSGGG